MNSKKRKRLLDVIIILCVFIIVSVVGINWYNNNEYVENTKIALEETKDVTYCDNNNESTSVDHELPEFEYNEVIGKIYFPSLELEVPLLYGNPEDGFMKAMESGAALDSESSLPGEESSIVISGHKNYDFINLQYLVEGDPIILEIDGNIYTYTVSKIEVIDDENINAVYYNENNLVLYTCYPFERGSGNPERYVVHAKPVEKVKCDLGVDPTEYENLVTEASAIGIDVETVVDDTMSEEEKVTVLQEEIDTVNTDKAPDTDGDGVKDNKDVCAGYDDNLDDDDNGIPNDCDDNGVNNADYDNDGVLDMNDYYPHDPKQY